MKRPHPLLVLLLLLAILPAMAGGSLTHLCACEGLMYVAGCPCLDDSQSAKPTPDCACGGAHIRSGRLPGDTTGHSPTPTTPDPATPHDCDYMAYQMSLSSVQAQLPPCPMTLLHEACMPLPVWQHRRSVTPGTEPLLSRHLPNNERPRPLLI